MVAMSMQAWTGTVVGFVYSTVEGANPICERPDVSTAARLEPQIPVVLMRVDEEFWKAPEHNFTINPPLPKKENWERVIAIPPVESRSVFKMKFQGGQKKIKKIQLPLILAFALTIHKAQGLTKDYVLFIASSKLFARGLSYVAISRCVSLDGLYLIGAKVTTKHFKQTFGVEDAVIRAETTRWRIFQGNTLRQGYIAMCKYKNVQYDSDTPIVFPQDEPEFDNS
jgi:hypothetical protein